VEQLKAKVFISCGQQSEAEREAAKEMAQELLSLGFEPYVAVQQQSLGGLKENIFRQLSDSEYFLFVDFRREQLGESGPWRGSLFSNQELAIASYLDLKFMGFQQNGVAREGVLSFLQGNCVGFDDPAELRGLVRSRVNELEWVPNWKSKLLLERDANENSYGSFVGGPVDSVRWFHLRVRNLSAYKTAVGCRAYIGRVAKLDHRFMTGVPPGLGKPDGVSDALGTVGKPVELKWGGYVFPDVIIPPGRSRDLDAGFIEADKPNILQFKSFRDSPEYGGYLQGPDEFVVTYVVISENFPETELSVEVTLGNTMQDARVEPLSGA